MVEAAAWYLSPANGATFSAVGRIRVPIDASATTACSVLDMGITDTAISTLPAVIMIAFEILADAAAAGLSRVARVATKPAVVGIGVEIGAVAVAADLPFYATFLPLYAKSVGAGQGHAAHPRLAYAPVSTQAI